MPFLLLLLLAPACLPDQWKDPLLPNISPRESAAATWVGVVLVIGLAAIVAQRVRLLAHAAPSRSEVVRRYVRWRFVHSLVMFAVYGLTLYVLGWGWALQQLCGWTDRLPTGGEILVLAPFLAALILSWACFYDAERALHETSSRADEEEYWTRRGYLTYYIRYNFALVFLPILLLIAEKASRPYLIQLGGDNTLQTTLLCVGAVLSAYTLLPLGLRLALGLRPLPAGPLRDRLQATARRLRLRCSNILLWDTRRNVVNAMVVGLVPMLRYVVLTDRLAEELTEDEVEAVFGHEAGHVKHHHMAYYFGFLLVSLTTVWSLAAVYAPALEGWAEFLENSDLAVVPVVAAVGLYIFVVFGFLSRRCERQADLYGCRAVSCGQGSCAGHGTETVLPLGGGRLCATGIRTFIEALEKVARLNGISRDRPGWLQSWQHSTIARRVEFLEEVIRDPGLEHRFQRRVAFVKWGLLLGLGGLLAVLCQIYGWDKLQI